MKVYIVQITGYEGGAIHGVYAKAKVAEESAKRPSGCPDFDYEEFEVE